MAWPWIKMMQHSFVFKFVLFKDEVRCGQKSQTDYVIMACDTDQWLWFGLCFQ